MYKKDTSTKRVLVYGNNRNYAMNMHETENDFTLQQFVKSNSNVLSFFRSVVIVVCSFILLMGLNIH